MKKNRLNRSFIFIRDTFAIPAGLLLIASGAMAQGDDVQTVTSFAKFDGVTGEASDPQHKGWIDVLAVTWNIKRPTASGTGQKRRLGAPVVGDLTMSIRLDKASPELALKGLTGEVIPKLEIEQTANYGGGSQSVYYKYELINVIVTSYQTGGSAGGGLIDGSTSGSTLVINLSLGFEEIKVTYTENDAETGVAKGSTEMSWKIEEGVK